MKKLLQFVHKTHHTSLVLNIKQLEIKMSLSQRIRLQYAIQLCDITLCTCILKNVKGVGDQAIICYISLNFNMQHSI